MGNKKEITNPDLSTEEVKDLELDEQPKPQEKLVTLLFLSQMNLNPIKLVEIIKRNNR